MPRIEFIPVRAAMSQEDVATRLSSGWRILGTQLCTTGKSGLATPQSPGGNPAVEVYNIWVLPEPMFPAGDVARVIASAAEAFADNFQAMAAIDQIAMTLVGVSGAQVLATLKKVGAEVDVLETLPKDAVIH